MKKNERKKERGRERERERERAEGEDREKDMAVQMRDSNERLINRIKIVTLRRCKMRRDANVTAVDEAINVYFQNNRSARGKYVHTLLSKQNQTYIYVFSFPTLGTSFR